MLWLIVFTGVRDSQHRLDVLLSFWDALRTTQHLPALIRGRRQVRAHPRLRRRCYGELLGGPGIFRVERRNELRETACRVDNRVFIGPGFGVCGTATARAGQ